MSEQPHQPRLNNGKVHVNSSKTLKRVICTDTALLNEPHTEPSPGSIHERAAVFLSAKKVLHCTELLVDVHC